MDSAVQDGLTDGTAGTSDPERRESGRDRVRRLLFVPLGFRGAKGHDPAKLQVYLDQLADDIGYLSDGGLTVLGQMMAGKGDGVQRCFWPPRGAFVAHAEIVQPRPLAELPALSRWFASIEGQRMVQDGTLAETWLWFQRKKSPPFSPAHRAMIQQEADENRRRLQIIAERRDAGFGIAPDELEFERSYRDLVARLQAMVAAGGVPVRATAGAA